MKRILCLLLLAAMLLSVAACNPTPSVNEDTDSSEPTVSDEPTSDVEEPTSDIEEPTQQPADEKFVYKHVIIVGIDGMGAYHKGANTPNIDAIFADYALTDIAQTYNPVASGPCWFSMLTGVDPRVMRTTQNPSFANATLMQRYSDAIKKYPTLFAMFNEKYPDSNIASIARWEVLDDIFAEIGDYLYQAGNNPVHWTTQEELDNALAYIETIDTSKNNFAFFYFCEPDSTGHKKTWGSAEFNAMLTECDAALGEIFKAVEEKGMLEDTLFILATDHGGDGTKHGGIYTPAALDITLGFRGKTINNVKDFPMIFRDIAAIVVEAMDLEPSSAWAKVEEPPVVPEGLFKAE